MFALIVYGHVGRGAPLSRVSGAPKRVLIVCAIDGFANGQKPVEIERFLRSRGHEVAIANVFSQGRASENRDSWLHKMPHPHPLRFLLWLTELGSLMFTRRWKWGRRHLSYYLIRADLRLRSMILRSSLPVDEFDMIIGEHPYVSEFMTVPTTARVLYDCMTPWADELYYEGRLTESQWDRMRRHEADILDRVDLVSFSWETYAPYAVRHYGIRGDNLLQLNWGCAPARDRVRFASPPRVVVLSSLSSNFINLPLLSRLSRLYPIDVYGGPPPDPSLDINYLGWAPPDVVGDYQIGLITCSQDELRREGFSAKNTMYVAHGLPVLIPAWRRHMELLRGCIPYDEDTLLAAIERLSDPQEWQRVSDEAYEQAEEIRWDRTLEPLDGALYDPTFRYLTDYMSAAIHGGDGAASTEPRSEDLGRAQS
jgi:hypothetical protein